jgi:hypothetical protein
MNAKPTLASPRAGITFAAAALAALIGLGLLSSVTVLFQRDGSPYEQVVVAERACASNVYQSERASCVRDYLAAAQAKKVAAR